MINICRMGPVKSPLKVVVIGAGAAGLCSGKHLIDDPENFQFDIFETQDDVGGTWRYSERVGEDEFGLPIHSSMYKNLKTNLPKEIMAFPGFSFGNCDGQSFLHHTQVLEYLKNYAQYYGLYKHIKFHKLVKNVKPLTQSKDELKWLVSYSDIISKEMETKIYDAVIVCNGHYSVPHKPEIEGINDFKGILMHSHDYRVASDFKGLKVVVLGAGSSGVDIAIEIANGAKEVVLSHNSPPKESFLPENLTQERGIESVQEASVTFIEGKTYKCDAIIFCTGYAYSYPFIDPVCNLNIKDQHVSPLYLHTFHIDYPTLSILGIPKLIIPFPVFDQQVKVILKHLKGTIKLPSPETMRAAEKKDFEKRLESGFKPRHAHIMPGQWKWDFDNSLCEIGQLEPISDVVVKLYNHVHQLRSKDLVNYKKTSFCLLNNETFFQLE